MESTEDETLQPDRGNEDQTRWKAPVVYVSDYLIILSETKWLYPLLCLLLTFFADVVYIEREKDKAMTLDDAQEQRMELDMRFV